MPKIQAVTDEMTATAGRIGSSVELMEGSQEKVRQFMATIMVHFRSTPSVLSAMHLSNVVSGYRNTSESLKGYQGFLVDAANTYEWNDQQLARWGTVMQDQKGVDIYNYNPPSGNNDNTTGGDRPAGGWDASGGWDSVGATFPTSRPNLSSKYYDIYVNANKHLGDEWYAQHPYTKQYVDGVPHINCVAYARKRALEVNQMDTYRAYPNSGSGTEIRSNSVAYYHNSKGLAHAVYVEHYDEATQTVYFTEGNWGSDPDGKLKTLSLDEFKSRQGWHIANYDYYPPA